MWLTFLLYQLAFVLLTKAQNACIGHPSYRPPVNSDIDVRCGSEMVSLKIQLCPIYFNGYNESSVALNSKHSKPECKGTADWTVDPPVLKFNIPFNGEAISACDTNLIVSEEVGSGVFSDFSTVQYVNISGMVTSEDYGNVTITYQQEVMYRFSCRYPLQYLVNNTQMTVAGVNLAVKDTNGSFISTLSMQLYADILYTEVLKIPSEGLELKTRVFVEVRASNLTSKFHVLLDRCYATTSPFHTSTSSYDLFIGCNKDTQTVILVNGEQQYARFSFETFRFSHHDATSSIYYIHCATRLCVNTVCPSLVQDCTQSRRRRSADDEKDTEVTDPATVTSEAIRTHTESQMVVSGGFMQTHTDGTVVVVSIIAGIIGLICLVLVAFIIYHMCYSDLKINKTILFAQE